MKSSCRTVVLLLLVLPGCSRSQPDPPAQRIVAGNLPATLTTGPQTSRPGSSRLNVQLRDGSLIVATPVRDDIGLSSSYGVINAPFSKIRTLLISDTAGSATVMFRNGDRIQGILQTEDIQLETALGRLDIRVSNIVQITTAQSADEITDGLVAWFRLDGTTDDAGTHGHSGVNHGAIPCGDRFGKAGGAYEFNGNGAYIALPDGLVNPDGPEFSWTVWATPREISAYRVLLYIGANTAESGLFVKDGSMMFSVATADRQNFAVSAPAQAGRIVHIACVYRRGKSLQLWVDGALAAEAPVPARSLLTGSNEHSSTIGSYAPEQQNHMRVYKILTWSGTVDDVRIYDRALRESEIRTLAGDRP